MEPLIKAILRPFWRLAQPLRRRLTVRFDQHLTHLVTVALREHVQGSMLPRLDHARDALERIETSVTASRSISENVAADTNLLLDSLVREIGRLQMQIEALHGSLGEIRGHAGLALISEAEDEPVGHMKAG
jgi:hypothetical protein